ncbi:hypothetical protein M5D96_012397 [Drosophila gunungcola]|uniref:Uncharacterized protein n=1 Tax=Drosophila gunungcola TaxID=103775 RepID=A0A9Q0BK57_9MUSC|nr:hypothetical protein M5D96_012397 [Drosophila gunungcola]
MRAGKKQAAESVKTRPCIVYVRNLREEEESPSPRGATPAGKLRKRDNQRESQQELRETRTSRRSGGLVGAVQDKPSPRTRQAVKPAASPSPPPRSKIIRESVSKESVNMAKRRTTVLLGSSGGHPHAGGANPHKLGLLKARRSTQAESPKQQTYKPASAAARHVPASPPPTIAASRSRRSIKPNPKYASEDMVTPKYMASMGDGGGGSHSVAGRHGRQAKQQFANDDDISDLLDLDEDDDDELADAAFNPQLHKSDEDDDDEDEDISEAEYEQELRRKLPPVKRGPGVNAKVAINSAGGRTAPSSLQQLRRTMAVNIARSNASMTEGSGSGSGPGPASAKRRLETSESESPVVRKRMVISSTGGGPQQRAVPVVNGATTTKTVTPSASTRPKLGQAGSVPARMLPQRRGSTHKMNSSTNSNSHAVSSTPTTRSAVGGASNSVEKNESEGDDVPTFTIVNIDDIINQDDVLITRSHSAVAAAAASNASKKQAVGRPRTRNILSSNLGVGEKKSITVNSEKSTPAAATNNAVGNPAKRIKILASNSSVNTKLGPLHIQSQSQNQIQLPKPRPRILNTEMGKKTQSMKPLMSMGKELCPTYADTEEDDPDPDLDFDDDEIPASIVTRKNPKQAAAPAASAAAGGGGGGGGPPTSGVNKWNSNRRNVLSTTASTVNARADRKLSKLLGEVDEQPVFKKPSLSPQRRSKENQQLQQEQRVKEEAAQKDPPSASGGGAEGSGSPKYFPPETTTFCEEDGRVVKKITCYETWHVISTPKDSPGKPTRQQRTCLELALVKLANVAARIKVPSGKWSSKVTLYKVSPSLMTRQTMTIFTGDLKAYNIPEEDRHKYQPSCVLFRRSVVDRSKCRVPYDRAIIFKNKCFYANIDGKHVNLMGAPETVSTVKDVEILLDIVDRLSLSSTLVEMVNTK